MLSASSRLLVFNEVATTAIYQGKPQLVEYFVGKVNIDFHNDRDFAVMVVKLQLLRRSGFIIMNVYIPSLLLLVISYLTLYFTPFNFQVRVLASLTSLLVMATLYTQASSSLPKTSYFKMVDVWLLSSIFFIFIIIVLHTVIDRVREWEPTSKDPSGAKKISASPAPSEKSSSSNTVHPSEAEVKVGGAEAPRPTDVEEPSSSWWGLDLCVKQSTSCGSLDATPPPRPLYEKIILGARALVLALLVLFNIIYWAIVLK
ncbi:uncharacterized protein [Panulirus ornatus]|uniref:uncharacterized protein n=1 Tax=Panulirus ornatus TaxID=150431 RepID=UPI003A83B537